MLSYAALRVLLLADALELSDTSLKTLPVRLRELARGTALESLTSDAARGREGCSRMALESAVLAWEARADEELRLDAFFPFADCFGFGLMPF